MCRVLRSGWETSSSTAGCKAERRPLTTVLSLTSNSCAGGREEGMCSGAVGA